MAYVNQDPNAPRPTPQRALDLAVLAQLRQLLARPQWRMGCMLTLAALLTGLVLLLALAPPYAGLAAGLDLHPARLFAPVQSYLFRNAVINTGILLAGVYAVAMTLGWTWAVTGIPPRTRPF